MRTHHHQLIAVALFLACGRQPEPTPVVVTPEQHPQAVTAVTVVPGTHDRLWLTHDGVVDNAGKLLLASGGLPYDDLVSLGADRVALIRENDGDVFELSTHRLVSRFCYLPDSLPLSSSQRSMGIGWDAAAQRIYVQPLTFQNGQRVGGAQVGVFRADLATPLEWQAVSPPDMQAGGIAVQSRDRIWLGWKSTLYLYDANAQKVTRTVPLELAHDISSLAVDGDTLLVLDSGGTLSTFTP